MKRYRSFMDGVRVSGTLHQRLRELEEPGKRPAPWKKYGAVAAALLLVCGLGGYGAWAAHVNSRSAPLPSYPPGWQGVPEIGAVGAPDIATAEPGGPAEPAPHILAGSYEVTRDGVTTHYLLPYIEYGEEEGVETPMDWDVPPGSVKRELTQEEIAALMGGEDVLSDHLAWGEEYALSGWAAWYGDGSFWGAYIMGHAGELDHFEFSVTADQMPPTCVVYSEGVTQEIRGLTVIAEGHDSAAGPGGGVDASTRRVSFMKDDYGYRFDLTGASCALTEQRVSRLVCHVADRGLELSVVGGAIPEFVPDYDPTYEDGVPEQDTSANDPRSYAYNEPWVCPDCGAHVPAGEGHTCELCQLPLAPDTHTCEVCGQALPAGVEHSHGVICPDCGESYAEGTAHTCRQEGHHQEGHHGGHH